MNQRLVAKRGRLPPHRASPKDFPRTEHHPQTVMEGVYANPPLAHALTALLGCVVDVHLQSGLVYEGILRAVSPQLDVVLEVAHIKNKPPTRDNVVKTVEVKFSNITSVSAKTDANPTLGSKDMFKTDSEISRCNGPAGSKELQPFHFDEGVDGTSDYFHDSQERGWSVEAMFSVNEEKFQVSSSYDEEMLDYTTKLSKSDSEQYRHRAERAAQLASEIEAKDMSRSLYQVDDVGTEEEMFSAVVRQPEATPPQATPTPEPHPSPSVDSPQMSESHQNGTSEVSSVTAAGEEPSSLEASVPSGGKEEGEGGGGSEGGEAVTAESPDEGIPENDKLPDKQPEITEEAPSEMSSVSEDSGLSKVDLPAAEEVGGAKEEVIAEDSIRKFKLDPNAREFKLDPNVKEFVPSGAVSTRASPSPVTTLTNASRTSPSSVTHHVTGHVTGHMQGARRQQQHHKPPRSRQAYIPEASFQMSPVSTGYAFATPPPTVSGAVLRPLQPTSAGQMLYNVPQYHNAGAFIGQLPQQQIVGGPASGKVFTQADLSQHQQYIAMGKPPLLSQSISAPMMQPPVSQPQPHQVLVHGGMPQQMLYIPGSSSAGLMQMPAAANIHLGSMQPTFLPSGQTLPTGQVVMPQHHRVYYPATGK